MIEKFYMRLIYFFEHGQEYLMALFILTLIVVLYLLKKEKKKSYFKKNFDYIKVPHNQGLITIEGDSFTLQDLLDKIEEEVKTNIKEDVQVNKEERKKRLHAFDENSSPYEVLNVSVDSTVMEINKAFKERLKEYHPDYYSFLGEEIVLIAKKKTQIIIDARNSLIN